MHRTSANKYPPSLAAFVLLFLTITHLASSQDTTPITPTTLHFFPRTSCNRGTSLSYTTVADLYADTTCHTTPVGTESLYVDGIAGGCAVRAFSDSACAPSALLSQVPVEAGTCWFFGEGNSIGAWMGFCGAAAGGDGSGSGSANASMLGKTSTSDTSNLSTSTSSTVGFGTMSAPANSTIPAVGGSGRGNTTATFRTGDSATPTPGLQSPGPERSGGVVRSGVAGLREDDWTRSIAFKALLAMGSAEVVWGFV